MLTTTNALLELDEFLESGNTPTVDWLINLVKRTSGDIDGASLNSTYLLNRD